MYYPDGTRYDQVDGTGPVVRRDGTRYLAPSPCLSKIRDQGADPFIP